MAQLIQDPTTTTKNNAPQDSARAVESGWLDRVVGLFGRVGEFLLSSKFAFILLLVLQLKIMWAMWSFKDITGGDTLCYYHDACVGFNHMRYSFAWSPFYSFLGSLIVQPSRDPYYYCLAVRTLWVASAGALMLGIARQFLPRPLAWFVAAWWMSLPICFDSVYEIHLFACLPILAGWRLLLAKGENRAWRAAILAMMYLAGILVRNEQTLYASIFASTIAGFEVWNYWKARNKPSLWPVVKPYLVAALISFCVIGWFYARAVDHFPALTGIFRHKHTNNVGQIYTFTFKQRHPGVWQKDPWTEYGDLMTKTFGGPELTFFESLASNPPAIAEHCAYTASLIPAGLQLLLFSQVAGNQNPDYIEIPIRPFETTVLSALVLSILGAGLFCAFRLSDGLKLWFAERRWAITAMFCYVPVAFIVMVVQRPRASYVLAFGFEIMLLTGFCVWRMLRLAPPAMTAVRRLSPIAALALIALIPHYYVRQYEDRPLLDYVRFLQPYATQLAADTRFKVVPIYASEVPAYLFAGSSHLFRHEWIPVQQIIGDGHVSDEQIREKLREKNVGFVLVDKRRFPDALRSYVQRHPEWKRTGLIRGDLERVSLYELPGNSVERIDD